MTVCDSCKQLFDGLSDYCYECRDDMTDPKKPPILDSLNSQQTEMSESKPSTYVDDLAEILNEAKMQVTFTGWKSELEACEKERDSLKKELDAAKKQIEKLKSKLDK